MAIEFPNNKEISGEGKNGGGKESDLLSVKEEQIEKI